MLFGKNRDSEIGLWLPNCTRARTILLTTANFRTLFFPNSTTDPPTTYTNALLQACLDMVMLYCRWQMSTDCASPRVLKQALTDMRLMAIVHKYFETTI